ncbi:unnamed protein product [Cylicocyclus nassatus]|uniref:Transducer of regulated CREB activity N-terminal domain-containing protein n=1 Tax=Cylicocyclus nassatus TaxID=53992 RepID=A0AA36GN67_CYLNA|nr:unnamed protein product [Cylicocyclus nassatus]
MSGASPRKFAEKIAIMNRKQNEDVNTFDSIMREVRQITSTETQAIPSPSTSLHPPQWNQLGGSLPNVHQMPSYQDWTSGWPEIPSSHGSRSPEQHPMHYHPYGRGPRSPDRVPPLHPHYVPYPNPQQLLAAPEWNQINRARSDPQINQISMPMHMVQGNGGPIMVPHHMMQAGPSGMNMMPLGQQCPMPNAPNMIPSQPGMVPQSQSVGGPPQTPMQNVNMQSPLQSPMHYQMQSYGFPNGSPMQSPMGSPMGSSLMLDERTTPMMELSPPGMHDPCSEAGSLPNIHGMPQQQPPPFYHQTVGQRHSTGGALVGATRLAPTTVRTPESQSAPTSPANNLDPSQHLQWPGTRTFSNSPESLDIPRLVLTNPEGTNGPHLECFNDLEHLTLDTNDMQMLCNGSGNGNPVQQDSRYSSE